MEQNNIYRENLIEKFFDGLTTLEEERDLFRFFSEAEALPENLKQYKSTFQYFEKEFQEELDQIYKSESNAIVGADKKRQNNTLLNKKWMIVISAIAASLLFIFIANPFSDASDFNPYEGSFVKKNGIVVYDEAEVEAEYLRLEKIVQEKLTCLNEPFVEARQQVKVYEEMEDEITNKINKYEN